MTHSTRELTKEEGEALTKDMQAVLEKHNCDMGVVASIQLLKRVTLEPKEEPVPSPYPNGDDGEDKPAKEDD